MRERPRRNIVSFDVLIAFQMPAANLRWNPRPVRRRAIGGNIPATVSGRAKFHLQTRLPLPLQPVSHLIHVARPRRAFAPLIPKRLFNWPRDSFVIRRTSSWNSPAVSTRRSLLAPVSFLPVVPLLPPPHLALLLVVVVHQLPFGAALLVSDPCTVCEQERSREKEQRDPA